MKVVGATRTVAGLANVETRMPKRNDRIEEVDLSQIALPKGYSKRRRGTTVLAPSNREKRSAQ